MKIVVMEVYQKQPHNNDEKILLMFYWLFSLHGFQFFCTRF